MTVFADGLSRFFVVHMKDLCSVTSTSDGGVSRQSNVATGRRLSTVCQTISPLCGRQSGACTRVGGRLDPCNIYNLSFGRLRRRRGGFMGGCFGRRMVPILSPRVMSTGRPFPRLLDGRLCIITGLGRKSGAVLKVVPMPRCVSGVLCLPKCSVHCVHVRGVVLRFVSLIFSRRRVSSGGCVHMAEGTSMSPSSRTCTSDKSFHRIVRRALRGEEEVTIIHLRTTGSLDGRVRGCFYRGFGVHPRYVFQAGVPVGLSFVFTVTSGLPSSGGGALISMPFSPRPSSVLTRNGIVPRVGGGSTLLYCPCRDVRPFLRLVGRTSASPRILAVGVAVCHLTGGTQLMRCLYTTTRGKGRIAILVRLETHFSRRGGVS